MCGPILIIAGVVLMGAGLAGLGSWVGERGSRGGMSDASRIERQLMCLHFIALVLAPLLVGATLIALGLGKLL